MQKGRGEKKNAYVEVVPWPQVVWVLGIAKGGGNVHRRRNGLVVVDVVIGVNGKRSHRQLLVRESCGEPLGAVEDGIFGRGGRHVDDGVVDWNAQMVRFRTL